MNELTEVCLTARPSESEAIIQGFDWGGQANNRAIEEQKAEPQKLCVPAAVVEDGDPVRVIIP